MLLQSGRRAHRLQWALTEASRDAVESALAQRGFAVVTNLGETPRAFADSIGDVIDTTHVVVRTGGRALVTSDRALDLHTDHHRADYIVWHCHAPAEEGGETLLAQADDVLAQLDEQTKRTLTGIRLTEHSVFAGDVGAWPLLEHGARGPRLYYSFWLERPLSHEDEQSAMRRFREALWRAPRKRIRLNAGETLVIDNGRVLHGRTAIRGTRRHLERFWISTRSARQMENEQ